VRKVSIADDPEELSERIIYPPAIPLSLLCSFALPPTIVQVSLLFVLLTHSLPRLQLAELGSKYEPAEGITGI
jgi:hypothetical protein